MQTLENKMMANLVSFTYIGLQFGVVIAESHAQYILQMLHIVQSLRWTMLGCAAKAHKNLESTLFKMVTTDYWT